MCLPSSRGGTPTRKRRTSLDRLLELIETLPPARIADAQSALRDARRRAEATIEIDAAAEGRVCPGCGGGRKVRHGRARTGAQRWRCRRCERTWPGLTGTPVVGVPRPDLLVEMLRDALCGGPRSCRKLARALGVSHHAIWRWRLRALGRLAAPAEAVFAGVVEADETFQRESRKVSREWGRHRRDPARHPKPPRPRPRDHGRAGPPTLPGRPPWQMPLLGVADRGGHASVARLSDTRHATIAAALLPLVAQDAVLCDLWGRPVRRHRPPGQDRALRASQAGGAGGARRAPSPSTPWTPPRGMEGLREPRLARPRHQEPRRPQSLVLGPAHRRGRPPARPQADHRAITRGWPDRPPSVASAASSRQETKPCAVVMISPRRSSSSRRIRLPSTARPFIRRRTEPFGCKPSPGRWQLIAASARPCASRRASTSLPPARLCRRRHPRRSKARWGCQGARSPPTPLRCGGMGR